jgi:DNA-binding transcriptional LysR family regulator
MGRRGPEDDADVHFAREMRPWRLGSSRLRPATPTRDDAQPLSETPSASESHAYSGSAVLRVGCHPHLPIQRLLAFLGALGLREPHLETRVLHDGPVEQLRRLDRDELDVAILHDAVEHPDIESEPVFPGERLAVFLTVGHPLTAKQVLHAGDLLDADLVIFPRTEDPALYDHLLAEIDRGGYRFRGIVETPGPHVRDVLLEVARGRGVALGARSLAELSDAGGIVARRALDPPLSMPDTVLAWRTDRPPLLQQALGSARDVARELRRG